MNDEKPYLVVVEFNTVVKYNPNYGDDRICECGHTYDRHFDPFECNDAVGCKYCGCFNFVEKTVDSLPRCRYCGDSMALVGKSLFDNIFHCERCDREIEEPK